MNHLVYKITNEVNGRFYIGVHSTDNIDDGYLGSGVRIRNEINCYGVINFKREILANFPSRDEALKKEADLVTKETLKDILCLNLVAGGGGWPELKSNKKSNNKERGNIYRKNANPAQVKFIIPFDEKHKYRFSPNINAITEYKIYLDNLKSVLENKNDNSQDMRIKISLFLANEKHVSTICDYLEDLYNHKPSNETARKMLGKLHKSTFLDFIAIDRLPYLWHLNRNCIYYQDNARND